jgi:hypothetical protein
MNTAPAINLIPWLEAQAVSMGDDNQRERHASGVLPEDELLHLARAELFRPFADLRRWSSSGRSGVNLTASAVKHTKRCTAKDGTGVKFETCQAGELTHDEWRSLKTIQELAVAVDAHPWMRRAGAKVTIESQTHWATCARCEAEACRSSAKVSIQWAGRILTREYAL